MSGFTGRDMERMLRQMIKNKVIDPLTEDEIQLRVEEQKMKNYIEKMEDEYLRYHGVFAITTDKEEIKNKDQEIKIKLTKYIKKKKKQLTKDVIDVGFKVKE